MGYKSISKLPADSQALQAQLNCAEKYTGPVQSVFNVNVSIWALQQPHTFADGANVVH